MFYLKVWEMLLFLNMHVWIHRRKLCNVILQFIIPPQNIKMILYMDANTNRNFASAFGTQSSVTCLSTDLSITKGDTLADKYMK